MCREARLAQVNNQVVKQVRNYEQSEQLLSTSNETNMSQVKRLEGELARSERDVRTVCTLLQLQRFIV